jgi:signal transduction histidine kinase/streptogramin lyase
LRSILIAAALTLAAGSAEAQRLPITFYSTSDGLAHYVVNRIVRDSHGFLWFCTRDGLSRFDGRDFVSWGVDDGLPSGQIEDLIEAPDGIFWIATERGLVRFNPRGQRTARSGRADPSTAMFTTYLPAEDSRTARVSVVRRDPFGALWVGTAGGLFRADPRPNGQVSFTAIDLHILDVLQARAIGTLLVDRFGALWIGANGKVYRRSAAGAVDQLDTADGIPRSSVTRMIEVRSGRIWIAQLLGGLLQLTNDGPSARPHVLRHLTSGDGLPVGGAYDELEDGDGTLWVAGAGTLVKITFDDTRDGAVAIHSINERQGLRAQEVSALATDPHGNLWIGVIPNGVAKLSRSGFTTFAADDAHAVFMTLVETRNDQLVALTHARGRVSAYRFDGDAFARLPDGRPGFTASWAWNQMAFQDRTGAWWFGGNNGVVRYRAGVTIDRIAFAEPEATYSRANGLAADTVIRLFEDRRGDVWIATVGEGVTPNGLSVWHRGATNPLVNFTDRDGLPPLDRFYASAFAMDRAGNVWIGFSGDAGLVRYDGARFVRFTAADGLPPGQIRNLMIDAAGRLWAATYRGGICLVEGPEREHPSFLPYSTKDGLSSNETTAIVQAASGELYIGTARGVDKLQVNTGRFTHFTANDGLPPAEMQAALRDSHGTLWFVYTNSIVRLIPVPDQTPRAPEIFISGIEIDGRPRAVSAVGERSAGDIRLPSDASLRIDLVAPWFGASDGLLYQYRLRQDDAWSAPNRQRSITFAGLAPGRYTFMARALTNQGAVSPGIAAASFTVAAPVWRRSWFLLLMLSTVAAAGYLVFRRRMTRLLEVANMRTRIATDLHDDIGANLTRIAVLSEVARRRDAPALVDPLESIAALSRESVSAMADIVWAISPERDHLRDLVRKMREHADGLLTVRDVELTFTVFPLPEDDRLELDLRRDLFLIFKEAINNAARHSGCTAVDVAFGMVAGSLVLTVADNGRGFDAATEADGNGLVNMQRRASRIGAHLDIRSKPGRGTTVRLRMPLARRRWSKRLPA